MKLYWHELRDSTIKRAIKNKMTIAESIRRYKQPVWCSYPNALEGIMGCWSLVDAFGLRHKISPEYWGDCDCYIKPISQPKIEEVSHE